jgi:hypothetical protein
VNFRGSIYYFREFDVGWNHVHGANGDGICVIGHDGVVHDNICENGTTTFDNGLTPFIGSTNIRFIRNRVVDFPTAIGLDGSYLACTGLPGMKDAKESEALSLRKLWEVYRGREGYHRGHEIAENEILNCRRGIVLHRTQEILIHDNRISGRGIGEGVSLEESMDCKVWANRVSGWEIACRIYAHEWSALNEAGEHIGSSFNGIGVDREGARKGNDFRGNIRGIAFHRGVPDAHLRKNVLRNNDCRECDIPFDLKAGSDGGDRQYSSWNKPEEVNSPACPEKVQGP